MSTTSRLTTPGALQHAVPADVRRERDRKVHKQFARFREHYKSTKLYKYLAQREKTTRQRAAQDMQSAFRDHSKELLKDSDLNTRDNPSVRDTQTFRRHLELAFMTALFHAGGGIPYQMQITLETEIFIVRRFVSKLGKAAGSIASRGCMQFNLKAAVKLYIHQLSMLNEAGVPALQRVFEKRIRETRTQEVQHQMSLSFLLNEQDTLCYGLINEQNRHHHRLLEYQAEIEDWWRRLLIVTVEVFQARHTNDLVGTLQQELVGVKVSHAAYEKIVSSRHWRQQHATFDDVLSQHVFHELPDNTAQQAFRNDARRALPTAAGREW